MLGDNSANPALPVKPWEITGPHISPNINSISNAFAPPPPPLPLQDPYPVQNGSNWFGMSGSPTGGYYGNRFGYSSSYNSGFGSYSSPYYSNTGTFGSGPPAPGSFITSSLENTTRPLFDSLNHVLQAVNHVACFIDSTVFAVWTSVTAAGSIVSAIKNIRTVYLKKWIKSVGIFLQRAKLLLKTSSGRKKIVLFASILAIIPILLRALQSVLSFDESVESSLISFEKSTEIEGPAAEPEDNISEKAVFVRALYHHDPSDKNAYLTLNPGDVILISKNDASKLNGQIPTWITGKLKDGSTGYFPSNYVTVIK